MLRISDSLAIPESEFRWSYARSGGPGGQNVNKVASKAILRWDLQASPSVPPGVKRRLQAANPSSITSDGELLITSQKYREQERNRQDCREKLASMIRRAVAVRTPRIPTRPTAGSKHRRLVEKRHRSRRRSERRVDED